MDGKITVDEVNDFIKNFKLKNKMIKNNSQLYKKEGNNTNAEKALGIGQKNEEDNCRTVERKGEMIGKGIPQKDFMALEKDKESVDELFSNKDRNNGEEDVDDIFSTRNNYEDRIKPLKETVGINKTSSPKKEQSVVPPKKDIKQQQNQQEMHKDVDIFNDDNGIHYSPKKHDDDAQESINLVSQPKVSAYKNTEGSNKDKDNGRLTVQPPKKAAVSVINKNPFDDDDQAEDVNDFFNKDESEIIEPIIPIKKKNIISPVNSKPISPSKSPLPKKTNEEATISITQKDYKPQGEIILQEEHQNNYYSTVDPVQQNPSPNIINQDYNETNEDWSQQQPQIYPYIHPSQPSINNNQYTDQQPIIKPKIQQDPYNNNSTSINNTSSSMKHIYNNFSNELKAKEEIFQPINFNPEIEQLDKDDNQPPQINPQFRTNSIDESPHQAIEDSPFLIDNDQHLTESLTLTLGTRIINGQIIQSQGSKIIISSLKDLSNDKENKYFPISFSEQFNFESSIGHLENIQSMNNKGNIITRLAIYCQLMVLKKQLKLQSCNIFSKENNYIRQEMIEMIKESLLSNHQYKKFFSFDMQHINSDSNQNADISSLSLTSEQFKESLLNQSNMASFVLLSIISSQDDLNNSLMTMFDRGLINKNYYWYFLLMIKSGQIDTLIKDDPSLFFDHFPHVLLILLENYDSIPNPTKIIDIILKSNPEQMTYLHYMILFSLRNSFIIDNETLHGKLITQFLNIPTLKKIILSDVFNYFCYCLNPNLKKIIAKSSILIKFKYTLIQRYNCDRNVVELAKKINDNSAQFGAIGRNRHFKDYLMTSYLQCNDDKDDKNDDDYKDKEESKGSTGVNNEKSGSGGLVSSLFSAFGLGGGTSGNNATSTIQESTGKRELTKDEKAYMSAEELWKYEHPDEEEIYYDPVLKRYILRGKIYNDQDEAIHKENQAKPVVAPPKFNKPKQSPQINSNQDNQPQIQMQQAETKTKIANPFAGKVPPKPSVAQPRFQPPSLTNRYAVGYNP